MAGLRPRTGPSARTLRSTPKTTPTMTPPGGCARSVLKIGTTWHCSRWAPALAGSLHLRLVPRFGLLCQVPRHRLYSAVQGTGRQHGPFFWWYAHDGQNRLGTAPAVGTPRNTATGQTKVTSRSSLFGDGGLPAGGSTPPLCCLCSGSALAWQALKGNVGRRGPLQLRRRASSSHAWSYHSAPAAPAFTWPSLPSQFQRRGGGGALSLSPRPLPRLIGLQGLGPPSAPQDV